MSRFPNWFRYLLAIIVFIFAHQLQFSGGLILTRLDSPMGALIAFVIFMVGIEIMIVGYLPVRRLRYEALYRAAVFLWLLVLTGWGLVVGFRAIWAITESAYSFGPGVPEEVPIIGIASVSVANFIYFSRKYGLARHAKDSQRQVRATDRRSGSF